MRCLFLIRSRQWITEIIMKNTIATLTTAIAMTTIIVDAPTQTTSATFYASAQTKHLVKTNTQTKKQTHTLGQKRYAHATTKNAIAQQNRS